ncbi:glycosyl transferase [Nocardioides currus]|uniref:Glycosyl transferase n=1 Tax=Nocardioides currus TaxID=2133958 RepID=A0A2R7YXI7_9ACTN|nr:glycosyl transferase [Nocardioides currus]
MHLVVAYWGDPALLDLTMRSVLAQTDPRWRVTVIDDGYPDPAAQQTWGEHTDERISYQRNDVNLGVAGNFEKARQVAVADEDADLVAFLGSDDLLHPTYVANAWRVHEQHPDVDIVQLGVRVIDEAGEPADGLTERIKRALMPRGAGQHVLGGETLATSLLRGNWLYWPSLVFRREALGRVAFRADLPTILDLALVLDLVSGGSRLVVDPAVCFSYRRHAQSASSQGLHTGDRFDEDRRFFAESAGRMDAHGWPRAARAARRRWVSRLHALTLAPAALRLRSGDQLRAVARHALRR